MPEQTTPDTPLRIFLIRHARPEVTVKGWLNKTEAGQYISDYDAAIVEHFVLQHEAIPYKEVKKAYCSTLLRSQLTARAIFGEEIELIIDHTFREFERKIFRLPWLRLPVKVWLVLVRLLWFLGFNKRGIESFKEARKRARACAAILAEDAIKNKTTVLVAHGLLNHFIRRELRRLGWRSSLREGHGYLAVNMLELPYNII